MFDRVIDIDGVPDGYRATDDREAIKEMILRTNEEAGTCVRRSRHGPNQNRQ